MAPTGVPGSCWDDHECQEVAAGRRGQVRSIQHGQNEVSLLQQEGGKMEHGPQSYAMKSIQQGLGKGQT